MKKRVFLFSALAIVAVLGAIFGAKWAVYGRFIEKTDNAFVKADTVAISAKTPGRIAEVLVEDNTVVHKGDPLVRIELNDYTARVHQAEADSVKRRAALDSIGQQIAMNDAKISDAEAGVQAAQADVTLAQSDYGRTAELLKEGFATRATLDQRTNALNAAKARLDGANASLEAAKAGANVAKAQEEEARAGVAWGDAALELAQIDEANGVIRAPKDGVVGNVSIRVGEYASTGRQLMVVVPVQDAYVVANFKETQVERIRPGETVKIEVDAYPDADIVGVVDSLSPSSGAEFSLLPPENATGNFTKIVQRLPVKIRVKQEPGQIALLPGMSVVASVDTRGADLTEASLFAPRESGGSTVAAAGRP